LVKVTKIYIGEKTVFSANCVGKNEYSYEEN
jgi:hypothetical protein